MGQMKGHLYQGIPQTRVIWNELHVAPRSHIRKILATGDKIL